MSSINITPLTDVLLVLLITFLLSASSFQASTEMPLPRVAEAREVAESMTRVAIGANGGLEWPVPAMSELPIATAFAQLRVGADKPILALAVHRDLAYSQLYPVLVAADQGGWQRVVLLTEASD